MESTTRPGLVRVGPSYHRTIYQWSSELQGRHGETSHEVFRGAAARTGAWIKRKAVLAVPDLEHLLAHDWEIEDALQSLKSVAFPEAPAWGLRYRHNDTQVVGRVWTTDVVLSTEADQVCFFLRLTCSGAHDAVETAGLSVPAIVKTLASYFHLGGSGLSTNVQAVSDPGELRAFVDHLFNSTRAVPVLLLTEFDPRRADYPTERPFGLDPADLQKRLAGVAEVWTMASSVRTEFIEVLDKHWAAYHGAARIYQPGLHPDDDLFRHQLILGDRLRYFRWQGKEGFDAAADHLVDLLFQQNGRGSRPQALDVRRLVQARSTYHRSHAVDGAEFQSLLEQEIVELQQAIRERDEEIQTWLLEYSRQEDELKEAKDQLHRERTKLDAVRRGAPAVNPADPLADLPEDYTAFDDWALVHWPDRLEFHSRARRGLKAAVYHDKTLVGRCLQGLAEVYLPMRLGQRSPEDWQAFLNQNHVDMSKSISESRRGEEGDNYVVDRKGRRVTLEWHLKAGTSRDPREALRIYFFFDQADEVVVVGWLTSHLDTRST